MQPRAITTLLRGPARCLGFVGILACSAPASDPAPARDDRALSDPIVVQLGTREVHVRCALACEPAREQLTFLRDRCVVDPSSTPHHLGTSRPLIALGCCTEAITAYDQACDDGSLASCISRWSAECDSGRIPPR